jgi:hypothetical protein
MKWNVFVKPNDQNEIYFSFGMAKKRLMLIEPLIFNSTSNFVYNDEKTNKCLYHVTGRVPDATSGTATGHQHKEVEIGVEPGIRTRRTA